MSLIISFIVEDVMLFYAYAQRTGLGEGGELEFRPPGTAAD
jgi:hypothetical protein